jgi:hypothetical protein
MERFGVGGIGVQAGNLLWAKSRAYKVLTTLAVS